MKLIRKVNFINVLVLFLLFSSYVIIGNSVIDPDFGYRLRNGQYLVENGCRFFSMTDPYSYTMPSFKFIEHAWGTALVLYIVYKNFGMIGLSVLWSVLVFVGLYLSIGICKTDFYKKIPYGIFSNFLVVLVVSSLLYHFSVRVQIVSWFLLSLFLFIYFKKGLKKKVLYLTPLLFVLWVNMHGSFLMGLLTCSLLIFLKTFNIGFPEKISFTEVSRILKEARFKVCVKDWIILFLSFLATVLNPYGLYIWRQVLNEVTVGGLRWEVLEWRPNLLSFQLSYGLYMVISLYFTLRSRKKLSDARLYLYFFYLAGGLLAVRHFPLYLLVSLPITIDALGYFFSEIKALRGAQKRLLLSIKFINLFSIPLFLLIFIIVYGSWFRLSKGGYYPVEAVDYLKEDIPSGEIFSLYGWGGYLNWKLPERKVFVNGFMPIWSRESAPNGESTNAFKEYVELLDGKVDYKHVFKKYNVDTVLIPITRDAEGIDRLSERLIEVYKSYFGAESKKSLTDRLEEDGWNEVYEDDTAIILKKP